MAELLIQWERDIAILHNSAKNRVDPEIKACIDKLNQIAENSALPPRTIMSSGFVNSVKFSNFTKTSAPVISE